MSIETLLGGLKWNKETKQFLVVLVARLVETKTVFCDCVAICYAAKCRIIGFPDHNLLILISAVLLRK